MGKRKERDRIARVERGTGRNAVRKRNRDGGGTGDDENAKGQHSEKEDGESRRRSKRSNGTEERAVEEEKENRKRTGKGGAGQDRMIRTEYHIEKQETEYGRSMVRKRNERERK